MNCHGCLALTISNQHPPGFCPLGYEVIKDGSTKRPKGECSRPRNHPELIEALQNDDE